MDFKIFFLKLALDAPTGSSSVSSYLITSLEQLISDVTSPGITELGWGVNLEYGITAGWGGVGGYIRVMVRRQMTVTILYTGIGLLDSISFGWVGGGKLFLCFYLKNKLIFQHCMYVSLSLSLL